MAAPLQPEDRGGPDPAASELERRKRALEAKLAAHRSEAQPDEAGRRTGGLAGMGYALRLSSEFIAAIAVGAGLGWLIDSFAGTSPWGLILFLLLGFAAGVLNVLRSAGLMAPSAVRGPGEAPEKSSRPGPDGAR